MEKCPNCGRCPHCGHVPSAVPWTWQPYPWTYPAYPRPIWWSQQLQSQTAGTSPKVTFSTAVN